MVGKNTSKGGVHHTRIGALVKDISIEEGDWKRLEALVQRPFTASERISISDALSGYAAMREEYERDHVSAQDVKATLKAMSNLPDDEVHVAVEHCDSRTEERLIFALCRMGEKKDWSVSAHPPPKWKAAAMLALAEFPTPSSGPRFKWYRDPFARYAISLWKKLGRTDMSVWELEGDASPLVKFSTSLLALIENNSQAGPPGYSAVAKLLREVTS